MKNRVSATFALVTAVCLLAGCSGGSDDTSQGGSGQNQVQLLAPTPSLAGAAEVGDPSSATQLRKTAASVTSVSNGSAAPKLSAQAATVTSSDKKIGPISTKNPSEIFAANRIVDNPWQPKDINDLKLITLPPDTNTRTRMPTGKWSKAFFYQNPLNLDSYFQANGVADDPRNVGLDTNLANIFAYPNKLSLDDRIGMVSVSFPARRYIAYGDDPKADVYDLSNPLKTDTLIYSIEPNSLQDMRLSYVQPTEGRLPRQIDSFDELTVASSWKTPTGDKSMQVIAAEGSPYVTVRYTGLRPVIQVGQGILPRSAKDALNLPIPPIDYTQQESDSRIRAVAVGEDPLKPFSERGGVIVTPPLTGTKFRIVYDMPDRARSTPGTNNNTPVTPLLSYKELVIYSSIPITLQWDVASRSYISPDVFNGVIRTAFVDDVPQETQGLSATEVSNIPSFKSRRAILDRYAQTFPTSSKLFIDYNDQETGTVTYGWNTERMDGQTAQGSDLLMMGFDATHIPSLQNPNKVEGLTYRSNFGTMSAIAGNEWQQKLTIPLILRNGGGSKEFWNGTGEIKKGSPEEIRIRASLIADTKMFTKDFLTTCNSDSYICGKYLHNIARLALIANSLGENDIRKELTAYLKTSLGLWLDGVGGKVDPQDPSNDAFLYDRTNGGTITSKGLLDYDKDYHNRAYVDHMFHYGYYIYAASVVASLDPDRVDWLANNKEKINLLVRDIANPSMDDKFFPIVRTFDWFRMQNIADAGPDTNGGNTESSSESINSNYALMTWGVVTKNSDFQALAAIMTAAEIRTAQAFYQVTPDTSYLKDNELLPVDVTVRLPENRSEMRTI